MPAGTVMVSAPGAALAAAIASRSEQSPSHVPSLVSAVFVTVKVAARAVDGRSVSPAISATAAVRTASVHLVPMRMVSSSHEPVAC